MSPKPEGSFEVAQSQPRWMTRSLARASVHLGQAVTGALSERLDALEEKLNSAAIPKSGGAAHGRMRDLLNQDRALLAVRDNAARKVRSEEDEPEQREATVVVPKRAGSRGAAQGRMRELLQRDREMLAGNDDWDDDEIAPVQPVAKAAQPMAAEPLAREPMAREPLAREPLAREPLAVVASPVIRVSEPPAVAETKKPAEDGDENAPIRTRTMARLFALQGHKDKALSIYDELIKRDPWDNGLIEEAERLRR